MLANGWRSHPSALSWLGQNLVDQDDGLAAVTFDQPRLPRPAGLRDFRGRAEYLRACKPSAIGELRTRVTTAVAAKACEYLGVDTVTYVAHSLGAVDAASAAIRAERYDITSITSLAPAAQSREKLAQLGQAGVRLFGMDFANDSMFRRNGPLEIFTGGYRLITEGCACHPQAAPGIASTLREMWQSATKGNNLVSEM